MKVIPYGDEALLVEPDDAASVLSLASAAAAEPGVLEVVPAARTILVRAAPDALDRLTARLSELVLDAFRPELDDADEVVLDVHYDGPDLADTAHELGLAADALVQRHAGGEYVVAFCGFAPVFGRRRVSRWQWCCCGDIGFGPQFLQRRWSPMPRRPARLASRASAPASTRASRRVGGGCWAAPMHGCGTSTALPRHC